MRRRRLSGALASMVLSAGLLVGVSGAATAQRIAGPDRFATATAVADAVYAREPMREIVIARGDQFADALSSTNVGFDNHALLLTLPDVVPQVVIDFIGRADIDEATLVGGSQAISADVQQSLESAGVRTHRIAGADRYETAVRTVKAQYGFEGQFLPGRVDGKTTGFLASGEGFADAVAAAPVAQTRFPLLLTQRDALPPPTAEYLSTDGTVTFEHIVILGGHQAVSPAVEAELLALGYSVQRVAGETRQETATLLADFAVQHLGWTLEHVNLARGDAFPDALAVGKLGATERAPTLLTASPNDLSAATRTYLQANADRIDTLHVIGDETAVSEQVASQASAAAT